MAQTKSEWRRALLRARAAIPESVRHGASADIAMRVRQLSCIRDARTLLGYVPVGAEVDLTGLLGAAVTHPITVRVPATPLVEDDPRWAVHSMANGGDQPVPASALEYPIVALVPGVGFDPFGTRLGRGGGFYDHALRRLRRVGQVVVIGIAFDCQIVSELPCDPWDEQVDVIVSESRVVTTAVDQSSFVRRSS